MSGPKVIRIVTREEIIAICRRHLAQIDQALKRWQQDLTRLNLISDDDIKAMRGRRNRIAKLLDADEFSTLQKAAPAEIAFIENDAEERIAKEADRRARIRISSRRMTATAADLLESSELKNLGISADLMGTIRSIAAGDIQDPGVANAAINDVFAAMALDMETHRAKLTEKQTSLAAALDEGEPTQTFESWIKGQPNEKPSVNDRIDGYIARLESEYGEAATLPYLERLARISLEKDPDHQRMLADTLVLDLASEMGQHKELARLKSKLETLDAELATFDETVVDEARKSIAAVLSESDKQRMELVLKNGQSVLEKQQSSLAAATRRSAILTELSRLGYEVREGMETALAAGNQVIIQNANYPDYGVEIAAPPGERLQVRAVSIGDGAVEANTEKDRDRETVWCSEFEELSKAISEEGGQVVIERSTDAGAAPLKVVPKTSVDQRRPPIAVSKPKAMVRKTP